MTAHGNNKPWSDERVQKLRKLWLEGKSGAQIAEIMGGDLSRAAVIGKANRLGLPARDQPENFITQNATTNARMREKARRSSGATSSRPPKPGPQRKAAVIIGRITNDPPEVAERKAAAAAVAGIERVDRFTEAANDTAIPLLERRPFQCSWPVGSPDRPAEQLCCGLPVQTGANKAVATYCTRHAEKAVARVLVGGKPNAKAYERSLRRYAGA